MTEKEQIALNNFAQKISTARLVVDMGNKSAYGEDVSDLKFRIRQIRQVQRLFDVEYGKTNYEYKTLSGAVNVINSLLNDYRLTGQNILIESDILPIPVKNVTLFLSEVSSIPGSGETVEATNYWYGGGLAAWPSLEYALNAIPTNKRYGLTIGVEEDGNIVEYWWNDVLALDNDDIMLKYTDDGFYFYDGNGELENKLILDGNG